MTDQKTTIILMEDDATFRGLLAGGLKDAGYLVVETATGTQTKDALAAAKGHMVLVADRSVEKEGPNGFQIASELLEIYPELCVVYISGTHIAIRRRVLGARERAILKPFAISQLLATVRDLGG